MRKIYIIIILLLSAKNNFAQLVDIDYSLRIGRIQSWENYSFGCGGSCPCQESGPEEFTGYLYARDNINTSNIFSACQTKDINGDATGGNAYGQGATIYSNRVNAAYTITVGIRAFEDDAGNRCDYNSGDDCYISADYQNRNIRESVYPSNSSWTNSGDFGPGIPTHNAQYEYTWKYTGTGSSITPTCNNQSIAYTSGGIRSFSASLSTANTYRFSTCGSGGNTYIRIYASDGFTIVAQNDNNGPACATNLASLDFTPTSNGTYYIEISESSRGALTNNGTLNYQIVGPYSGTATLGTLSTTGPINFCDAGGDYGTAVSLSGYTNGLPSWEWGSNNGTWNNWVTGASAGDCCFPKKTSNSDGNADRIRVKVIGCTTTGYSSTVLIRNEYNEAPASLSKSLDNVCPGTTVTLTANFPTATNMNGNVQFYSGSCGGTLVATVAGNGTTTVATNITAPATTTTYFARYTGAFSGCGTTACVSTVLTINFGAPTATAQSAGTCTQIRANWNAQNGATSYRLDVATDAGFTSMVSGFNDLNVGNVTSFDLNLPLGTYYYRVRSVNACFTSGNSNVIGPFTISNPANNNDYRNAIDISANIAGGSAYSGSFNNSSYGTEGGEPTPNGVYASAWYKFTTPAGGFTSIDAYQAQSGSDNTAIAIYRSNGGTCPFGNLTQLADNYWCNESSGTVTTNCLLGNTTYYIQYGTQDCWYDGGTKGGYNISITPGSVASPDAACNAITLGGATLDPGESVNNTVVNNTCASREAGEPRSEINNTVWYKFVTPAAGLVSVDFHLGENGGGSDNPAIVAYKSSGGCTFGSLTEVGNDIPGLGTDANSDFTVTCLEGGKTYFIQCGYNDRTLDGGSAGVFDLDIAANGSSSGQDNACSAADMGTLNGLLASLTANSQSNECAGTQANEPSGGQKTVWYKFTTGATVAKDFNINVDAYSNGMDAEVYVYEACTPPICTGLTLNPSEFNELANFYNGALFPALGIGEWDASGTISGSIKPNTTYYIRVDGVDAFGGLSGNFNLSISFSGGAYASNDDFCNATDLNNDFNYNSTGLTGSGNTGNASSQDICSLNEPNNSGDRSLWWKFRTGGSPPAKITIDPNANGWDCTGWAGVYSGSVTCPIPDYSSNHFSTLSYINSSSVGLSFDLNCPAANTTYYIQGQVGGICTSSDKSMSVTVVSDGAEKGPDRACDATSLGTLNSGGTLTKNNFNNYCADDEAGEPNTSGSDETVWYKFKTGAYPSQKLTVDVSAIGGSGDGGACVLGEIVAGWVKIYKYTGADATNGTVTCGSFANITASGLEIETGVDVSDINLICPEANTWYYIQIETGGLATCDKAKFNVVVTDNGVPAIGNNICSAIDLGTLNNGATISGATIPGVGYKTKFSTECATKQTNEPFVSSIASEGSTQEGTVWMKFTTAATGVGVKTRFDASAEDEALTEFSELRVYTMSGACNDANLSNLTMVPNVEDQVGYDATPVLGCVPEIDYSNMTAGCLLPNTTYYVQVHIEETPDVGATDEQANFTFSIVNSKDKSIGNDLVCNAVALPNIPNSAPPSNSTYGGTVTLLEQNNYCAGNAGDYPSTNYSDLNQTVWYSFLAPASGSAQFHIYNDATPYTDAIRLQATVYDPVGGVVGDNLATNCTKPLAELNSYDCGVGVTSCDIEWTDQFYADCMTPGKMYFLRVDGYYAGISYCNEDYFRGKFHIDVRDYDAWPAPNDRICNAVALGALNTTATACHPTAGISAPNNNYAKASCVLGRTPDNYCATATGEPTPSAWSPVANVWFSFEAPASGRVMIATQNDPQNINEDIFTKLAVYDSAGPGLCPNNDITLLREIDADFDTQDGVTDDNAFCSRGIYGTFWCTSCILPCEDLCNRDELLERVICLRPGELYYVTVDGINYNRPLDGCGDGVPEIEGKFDLYVIDIGGIPSSVVNTSQKNDNCVSAYNIGTAAAGVGGTIAANNFNNECATVEVGEPDPIGWDYNGGINIGNDGPDNTLWFKFVAPATGHVTVYIETDSKANTMDAQVAVYAMPSGSSTCVVSQLQEVRGEYDWVPPTSVGTKDEELELKCLIPGQTYFVQVDGEATALGCTDNEPVTEDDYLDGDLCKSGYFDVTITTNSTFLAPVNDNACAAKNLGVIDGGASPSKLVGETNWCATEETTEPNTSQLTNKYSLDYDETVWYYFTTGANPAGTRIEVTNSQIFNVLGVFGGTHTITIYETKNNAAVSCGNFTNLNEIASSGGIIGSANEDLEVECLKPNWRYYVQIDGLDLPNFEFGGKHTQYGSFDIQAIDGVSGGGIIPNEDYVCSAYNLGTVAALGTAQLLNQDNYCAGIEPGEPYVNGDPNDVNSLNYDETMWYKFTTANTPSNTRNIRVRVDGDNLVETDAIDISWVLYGGGPSCSGVSPYQIAQFGGLYELEQSDVISTFDEQQDVECLDPNTTYYLQIDGLDVLNLDHGNYSIYITDLGSGPIAGNDDICGTINLGTFTGGAQTLPASPTTYTNACASEQGAEPNVSGNPVPSDDGHDETVWFSFTTGATPGNITVSVNGASPTYSGKWQGFNVYRSISGAGMSTNCNATPAWSNLEYVGQSSVFNTTTPSLLLTCLPPNTIYYVQVDAWDDAVSGNIDGGTFTLSVSDNGVPITSPSNDNLANAYNFGTIPNLGSASVTAYANTNNYCATSENGEPNCDYNAPFNSGSYDETVWYKFTTSTSPNDILLDFTNTTTLAAEVNLNINLYESPIASPVFGNLTHVASLTQNLISGYDLRYNCAKPNQIYFIQVDGQDLLNDQVPDNVSGTNTSKGEWDLTVSSVGTSGLVHDNLTQTYNVGTVGNGCGNSISLAAGVETNNTCATTEASEPNVDAGSQPTNGADETVWYHFIAPSSGRVTITVDGDVTGTANDMDPSFNVYHSTLGTSLATAMSQLEYISGDRTYVAGVDVGPGVPFDKLAEVRDLYCLIPGHYYHLQIDGWDGPLADQFGQFSITISNSCTTFSPPANDECSGATSMTVNTTGTTCTEAGFGRAGNVTTTYNNNATISSNTWNNTCLTGDSYCAGDVWYQFTAPQTGTMILEGENTNDVDLDLPELGMIVYSGTCPSGLTPIRCTKSDENLGTTDITTTFPVTAGQTYFIKVFDADGSEDPGDGYQMCLTQTCSMDACANALPLQDDVAVCWDLSGSTGEPVSSGYLDCNSGEPAEHSIWYTFNAPDDPIDAAAGVTITLSGIMNVDISPGGTGCSQFGLWSCDRDGVSVAIMKDPTPCDGSYETLVDCFTTDLCEGALWGWSKTYTNLAPNASYVIMINSQDNGSGGCWATNFIVDHDPIDNGTLTISTVNNVPLPVELISFTGYHDVLAKTNNLNWITASEVNTAKFVVERSSDARNYSGIGEKAATGTSTVETSYDFTDYLPLAGDNYYRLRIVDNDGSISYSKAILIKVPIAPIAKAGILGIYPNPTTGKLTVQFQSSEKADYNFSIVNVIGQVMRSEIKTVSEGVNSFELNVEDFAQGVYIMNFKDHRGESFEGKFVKQ